MITLNVVYKSTSYFKHCKFVSPVHNIYLLACAMTFYVEHNLYYSPYLTWGVRKNINVILFIRFQNHQIIQCNGPLCVTFLKACCITFIYFVCVNKSLDLVIEIDIVWKAITVYSFRGHISVPLKNCAQVMPQLIQQHLVVLISIF